jgi:hypothetical protein
MHEGMMLSWAYWLQIYSTYIVWINFTVESSMIG